ncbi:hypothetical protein GCM10027422_05740 [Hymenobacter arcticus]
MADQVIFSQPYGRVLVDATVPCVITQWLAFANATEFVAMQGFALEYFEAHSTPARPWGWVGDVRQMSAIPDKAQQWLLTDFNPRALAAGLREVSVVLATSIFGQLATQRYAQETRQAPAERTLTTSFADSLAGAKENARRGLAQL